MFEFIVTIVLLISLAVWVLVKSAPINEIARWTVGISAIVLAILKLL